VSVEVKKYTMVTELNKHSFDDILSEQKDKSYNMLKMHSKYINQFTLLLLVFFPHSLNDIADAV